MIEKIDSASLKPLQKVEMLVTYAIPRLTYKLTMEDGCRRLHLEKLDALVKKAVKKCRVAHHTRSQNSLTFPPPYLYFSLTNET